MNMDCPCDKCQNSRVQRGEPAIPANVDTVPRADFDEALALLKEFQFQTDSASIPVCGDCGASEGLCAADCRLDVFIKKWSK